MVSKKRKPTDPTKRLSQEDGKKYLREAFKLQQEVLKTQLLQSNAAITHSGTKGHVNESYFLDIIRQYLPERYSVDQGIVVDSVGHTSHQIDVVIFDRHYTPTLLDQQGHRLIPAEAVYAVLEVKPAINKYNLNYAADKAESVRELIRTDAYFRHTNGVSKRGKLFDIIAGIVAVDVKWKDKLNSADFKNALKEINKNENRRLDCILALNCGCVDLFSDKDKACDETQIHQSDTESDMTATVNAVKLGVAGNDNAPIHFSSGDKLVLSGKCRIQRTSEKPKKEAEIINIDNLVSRGGDNPLMFFLFRLLRELQWLGTVPAIDWNKYAEILEGKDTKQKASN